MLKKVLLVSLCASSVIAHAAQPVVAEDTTAQETQRWQNRKDDARSFNNQKTAASVGGIVAGSLLVGLAAHKGYVDNTVWNYFLGWLACQNVIKVALDKKYPMKDKDFAAFAQAHHAQFVAQFLVTAGLTSLLLKLHNYTSNTCLQNYIVGTAVMGCMNSILDKEYKKTIEHDETKAQVAKEIQLDSVADYRRYGF